MLSSQGNSPVHTLPQQGCSKPPQVRHSPATHVAAGLHAVLQQGLPTAPQATHALPPVEPRAISWGAGC